MDIVRHLGDGGVVLRAISALRQPQAIEFLLGLIRNGRRAEAFAALDALEFHCDSSEIRLQIAQAVEERGEDTVRKYFQKRFAC